MFENLNNQGLIKITQNATGLPSGSVSPHIDQDCPSHHVTFNRLAPSTGESGLKLWGNTHARGTSSHS